MPNARLKKLLSVKRELKMIAYYINTDTIVLLKTQDFFCKKHKRNFAYFKYNIIIYDSGIKNYWSHN